MSRFAIACLSSVCFLTFTTAQEPSVQRGPYIDDDDQRELADLQFLVSGESGGALKIVIGATGPQVEAIGGYRGIRGANRYTAEELEMILNGEHAVRIVTEYEDTGFINGTVSEGRVGRIPERRLLPDGNIDYLSGTLVDYPLELLVNTRAETVGRRTTFVIVNGQRRLRCRYSIVAGKITDLEVQSLGSDHHFAAVRSNISPNVISVSLQKAESPVSDEEWRDRDLEGRWHFFRKDVDANPVRMQAWVDFLILKHEFELLEWLAIYHPDAFRTYKVGELLTTAKAPQWIRVAAWRCNSPPNIGHNEQIAHQILFQRDPGLAEHWLVKYQKEIDNWEKSVGKHLPTLLNDRIEPADSSALLPPLKPVDVFRFLNAPAEVVEFGDRKNAESNVVYVHQVIRAIDGVVISGRRAPELIQNVRNLTQHKSVPVRLAAFLAFSYLATDLPRTDRLIDFLTVINDSNEPKTISEAAMMGYSFHHHPSVLLQLLDVAENVNHPAWTAAVSRIGDVGKDFCVDLLKQLRTEELDAAQRKVLENTIKRLESFATTQSSVAAWDMVNRLALATFAEEVGHPHSGLLGEWTLESFKAMNATDRANFATWDVTSLGEFWKPKTEKSFQEAFDRLRQRILKSE